MSAKTPREKKLLEIFEICDSQTGQGLKQKRVGDGGISKKEFMIAVKKHEWVAEFFALPTQFKKESELKALDFFFEDLNQDDDGEVTWEEFKLLKKEHDRRFKKQGARSCKHAPRPPTCAPFLVGSWPGTVVG